MITRLELENWRCFRKADISFEPLTVIVGPNASGKTTLLRALASRFHDAGLDSFRGASGRVVRTLHRNGAVHHHARNADGQQDVRGWRPFGHRLMRLDPTPMRQPNTLSNEQELKFDGSNVHNVFATLTRREQVRVGEDLARLVPVISDVESRPAPDAPGSHWLLFQDRWEPQRWYTPNDVSDGTLYMLAYLLLAYEKDAPDVLCIEEPERGLHPYLLEQVMGLLRKLTTGEIGKKKIQVVLATQSPELLEHARPEEVRFLNRDPSDGSVIVEAAPTSEPEWREAFDTYERSLRGMWLSGTLGGVPGN